ncbi:MAG: YolD-like family protein [Lachnospiraceae bacterium]|nr:YolD-like family protein [Lachnospiraceae bacterium]
MAERRTKMSREDRAKQFMPFAALRGYEEAIKEKEKIIVDKIELSEEKKNELDIKFKDIHHKDIITIIYFHKDEYLKITGMVSKIDIDSRFIKVVNTKISFDDIYDINYE